MRRLVLATTLALIAAPALALPITGFPRLAFPSDTTATVSSSNCLPGAVICPKPAK